MTISRDLFLAILAMDSYNRGYGAGIGDGQNVDANGVDLDGLGEAGSQIGTAHIVDVEFPMGAQAAGFYAVAYTVNGNGVDGLADGATVISYRGTDAPDPRFCGVRRRVYPRP